MGFVKSSVLVCFLSFCLHAAEEQIYIFEAKGVFAKELKSLVEKYSKDGNASITVYEGGSLDRRDDGGFLNIGVNKKRKYSAVNGREIYARECASCHGENGEKRAYGESDKLKNMSASDIEAAFSGYLSDLSYGGRMKHMMRTVAAKITNRELGDIIAFLKGENALANEDSNGATVNTDVSTTPTQGSYLK